MLSADGRVLCIHTMEDYVELLPLTEQLFQELEMGPVNDSVIVQKNPLTITLELDGDLVLSIKEGQLGPVLYALTLPTPKERQNALIERLMEANLFGIETRGAAIGMEMDGEMITLSLQMPKELDYNAFKEGIENFANIVSYWKEEIKNWSAV